MNTHLRHYLDSFTLRKEFWTVFLIDLIFFGGIAIIFSRFGQYLQSTSATLMAGRTPEEIQQLLATAPEQALPFLEQLKSFLLLSFGSIILLVVLAFLLFSLEQAWIWNYLRKKKVTTKTYWRWNVLHVGLLIPLLIYGLGAGILKLLTSALFRVLANISPTLYFNHAAVIDSIVLILNNAVSFFLILFFLVVLYLIYYVFTEKYKVLVSIQDAFVLVKIHWSSWWRMILLMVLTAVVLTAILIPLRNWLLIYPLWNSLLNLIISFLFLGWTRMYVLSTLHHGHQ